MFNNYSGNINSSTFSVVPSVFVERYVSSSALFTFLVQLHASAVSLPPADVILAQLGCHQNDVIFVYKGNN
jgi:hypothetical protein